MIKLLLSIIIVVIISFSVIALNTFVKDPAYQGLNLHRKGVERVTNFDPRIQIESNSWYSMVKLEPPAIPILNRGSPDFFPRGTARIYSARYNRNIVAGIQLRVHELPTSVAAGFVFEGWFVDNATNFWLPFGVFDTIGRGTGEIQLQKLDHYLDVYDSIVITREPFPDPDPSPSKEIILEGKIERRAPVPFELDAQNKFNATVSQRLWGVDKFFS